MSRINSGTVSRSAGHTRGDGCTALAAARRASATLIPANSWRLTYCTSSFASFSVPWIVRRSRTPPEWTVICHDRLPRRVYVAPMTLLAPLPREHAPQSLGHEVAQIAVLVHGAVLGVLH